MRSTIELPSLPDGFSVEPNEVLNIEVSGASLHLLKWLVAEKRSDCETLAAAIDECIEQGFKYHKRLAEADAARKAERNRNLAQAQFQRWCELNPKKATDATERGYMMAQYGLLDAAIAEVFKAQMAERVKQQAAAELKKTAAPAKPEKAA